MAIVNKADADRDTIDSYLSELEGIHERQSEMLTKLHEELLEFRGSHYYFVQNEAWSGDLYPLYLELKEGWGYVRTVVNKNATKDQINHLINLCFRNIFFEE